MPDAAQVQPLPGERAGAGLDPAERSAGLRVSPTSSWLFATLFSIAAERDLTNVFEGAGYEVGPTVCAETLELAHD